MSSGTAISNSRGDRTLHIDNTTAMRNIDTSNKKRRRGYIEEETPTDDDYRDEEEENSGDHLSDGDHQYDDDETGEEEEEVTGGERLLFESPSPNSNSLKRHKEPRSASSATSSVTNSSISIGRTIKNKESRAISYWKERCMEAEQKAKMASMRDRCELYTDEQNQNACTRMQIQLIVKNIVFPKQKFIDMNELRDITSKNSLPNRMMDRMLIPQGDRYDTWNEYGILVKKHLDKVRCSRTTTMKDDFIANGESFYIKTAIDY